MFTKHCFETVTLVLQNVYFGKAILQITKESHHKKIPPSVWKKVQIALILVIPNIS